MGEQSSLRFPGSIIDMVTRTAKLGEPQINENWDIKCLRFVLLGGHLTLRKIAIWLSKIRQKLDIFWKKLPKIIFFPQIF